ncbi:MAG: aldehyde dehydrogenase family protein, partial [Psychrosphaera sp.]|nr:aldehyde dehydrogenase family protein [Psychrosphaera sp.]
MKNILTRQKAAFNKAPCPPIAQRKQQLSALKASLLNNKQLICDAVSQDFGYRNANETQILELMTTIGDINFTLNNLRKWMKPERRSVALQFLPASNTITYQPLGVVGIIVPWNYPLYLAMGPLLAALAAGNRAMLKMSEFTPALNAALKKILAECFTEDQVAII